jgi:transcription antitermination factor NusG
LYHEENQPEKIYKKLRTALSVKLEQSKDDCIWMPVRTKPRQEKKLKEYCDANGVVSYLPLLRKIHHYGKRHASFMVPMFPGYIFCLLKDDIYEKITFSKAVLFRIILDSTSEKILLNELRDIQTMEELSLVEELVVKPELVPGTPVEINSGPFRGIRGIIEYRKNKIIMTVNVDILGRSVSVEIDANSMDKEI